MTFLYYLVRLLFAILFKVFYRHKTFGASNIPKGCAIIAPNHLSFYDPPLIGVSCPKKVHFLARKTLFDIPIIGWCIKRLNAFPVRGSGQDLQTMKALVGLLKSGEKVIIFPEGVRAEDGELGEIKPGLAHIALRANAPVIPTLIQGTFEAWPRQRRYPKLFGHTTCVFGKPLYPKNYLQKDRKQAQKTLSEDIKKTLEKLRQQHIAPLQ